MEPRAGFRITGQLVLGVAIAVVGVLFTLDNLHVLRARDYLQFWPLALIAIGLVHVAQARTSAGVVGGAIWILVGARAARQPARPHDANIWNLLAAAARAGRRTHRPGRRCRHARRAAGDPAALTGDGSGQAAATAIWCRRSR